MSQTSQISITPSRFRNFLPWLALITLVPLSLFAREDQATSQVPSHGQSESSSGRTGQSQASDYERARRQARARDLVLGMCTGQSLAQQGIRVPVPAPGTPFHMDASTRAAVNGALQDCHEQMEGSPSPVPSASPAPSASPESVVPASA